MTRRGFFAALIGVVSLGRVPEWHERDAWATAITELEDGFRAAHDHYVVIRDLLAKGAPHRMMDAQAVR